MALVAAGKGEKVGTAFGRSVLRNEELDLVIFQDFATLSSLSTSPPTPNADPTPVVPLPSNSHLLRLLTLHLRHHPGFLLATSAMLYCLTEGSFGTNPWCQTLFPHVRDELKMWPDQMLNLHNFLYQYNSACFVRAKFFATTIP